MWSRLHHDYNERFELPSQPGEVPRRRQVFWLATECSAPAPHAQFKSVDGALRRPHTLKCLACTPINRIPKRGRCRPVDVVNEPKLWALLSEKFPGCAWAAQSRAVRMWDGAVDVLIYVGVGRKLMVEVDGFCHESEARGILGNTLEEQLQSDAAFNKAARDAGHRVLRLHPADFRSWAGLIADAMQWQEGGEEWAKLILSPTLSERASS